MSRSAMSAIAAVGTFLASGMIAATLAATTSECVSTSAQPSLAAYRRCTSTCSTTLAKKFATCFGPGRSCIRACQRARDACERVPNAAVLACQSDSTDALSCTSQLSSALANCASAPDRFQCRVTARLARVSCDQACFSAQALAIETCVETAAACEGVCPTK